MRQHYRLSNRAGISPSEFARFFGKHPTWALELGIRTALNKPVIIVRDDITPTEQVPFDVAIINNHTYATAPGWNLIGEIHGRSEHITHSVSGAENAFGSILD